MKLNNNTILITGGTSGIGKELAIKFAELNNTVIIVGRNEQKIIELEKLSKNITGIRCDLNKPEDYEKLLVNLESEFPELNVLINNAGVQYNYRIEELPYTSNKIDREININLNIPVELTAHLLPLLLSKLNSAIVNVTSSLKYGAKESAPVYCATKSALSHFTEALRYQLEKTSVKVFELIPPLVDTPMTEGRGKNKISAEQVAEEFINSFKKDKIEICIGKAKVAKILFYFLPFILKPIIRKS